MNKQEQAVYDALSVTEYTPGIEFGPRLEGLVPRDDVHRILKELETQGLTELCYGWGWRAIESPRSAIDPAMRRQIDLWREDVRSGATMLDFNRWFINEVVKTEQEHES